MFSLDGRLPFAANEMSESPLVAVEPDERFLRILGRWPVFHRFVFFEDAHIVFFTQSGGGIRPNTGPSHEIPVVAQYRRASNSRQIGRDAAPTTNFQVLP